VRRNTQRGQLATERALLTTTATAWAQAGGEGNDGSASARSISTPTCQGRAHRQALLTLLQKRASLQEDVEISQRRQLMTPDEYQKEFSA
jgi:hypothetical protein